MAADSHMAKSPPIPSSEARISGPSRSPSSAPLVGLRRCLPEDSRPRIARSRRLSRQCDGYRHIQCKHWIGHLHPRERQAPDRVAARAHDAEADEPYHNGRQEDDARQCEVDGTVGAEVTDDIVDGPDRRHSGGRGALFARNRGTKVVK